MIDVTVLVAVYNAEQYLPQCIASLQSQTLHDIQVVCIDDASTDGSLQLLQQYANDDDRIEVLHLSENHGQAYARNQGLKVAKGSYTCFLDADDWFDADALRLAVNEFKAHDDTDCVLFEVDYTYADRHETYVMSPFDRLSGEDAFRLSLDWQIHGVYMVRTELHRRIPYDDSCRAYSDDNTTRLHYYAARSVRRCNGVYHYRQHAASVTHSISSRRFDFLRANESMKRQLTALGADDGVMSLWETTRLLVLVDCYMFYHCHCHQLSRPEARYGLDEMHRVWSSIERHRLDRTLTAKFGYRLTPCWWMFRLQEWFYFTLRGMMGKNK